ncbi:hypothetical protein EDD21DRAFT_181560 [Dissophora ornata]|nr:hypothetical protein EDD21DRAFT_181560 [Dissophora ornata]
MTSNRIVSSTIVRPEADLRDDRRKRSFPDAPEPSRRSNVSSRLGNLSSSSSTSTTAAAAGDAFTGSNSATATAIADAPSTSATSATAAAAVTDRTSTTVDGTTSNGKMTAARDESDVTEPEDRTKRARISANPQEDTKRGRRMMGMILGTLSQFKNQQQQRSTASGTGGSSSNSSSGLASREALEERVREKLRREQELNEERRKKESQEREDRMRQQLLDRQASQKARQKKGVKGWENGYLLTETRPRLRYMPKVMNETTRRKFEAQNGGRGKGNTSSASVSAPAPVTSTGFTDTVSDDRTVAASELAASMDLDMEDVVVVADVKDEKVPKNSKSPISNASSTTVPNSPTAATKEITEESSKSGGEQEELINISLV